MNIITILVLLTLQDQTTAMLVLDEFPSSQKCHDAVKEFVAERHLPEQQARRLKCLTIVKDE